MAAPFIPRALSSALVSVGLASARQQLPANGGQVILKAPSSNSDNVHVEFGDSTVNAVVPTAGGGFIGGFTLGPGDMVELTVPSGQLAAAAAGTINLAFISLTAAQRLFIAVGADG